jgi:hypothetical protein
VVAVAVPPSFGELVRVPPRAQGVVGEGFRKTHEALYNSSSKFNANRRDHLDRFPFENRWGITPLSNRL